MLRSMLAETESTGLADPFTRIVMALCDLIAARLSRPLTIRQRLARPLLLLLWSSLRRRIVRFARLAARAGPPDPRSPTGARDAGAGVRRPVDRLPRGHGWIIWLLGSEAAALAGQLSYLMGGAEMAAFLAGTPRAARLLRPLCHGLAIGGLVMPSPPVRADVTRSTTPRSGPSDLGQGDRGQDDPPTKPLMKRSGGVQAEAGPIVSKSR